MIVCGPCGQEFDSEETYIAHVCPSSNTTPTDPAYLGGSFALVSQKAQERGAARATEAPAPSVDYGSTGTNETFVPPITG